MTKKNSFEDSLKELENIVSKLESGELALEKSLEQFEVGTKLYKECKDQLSIAEKKRVYFIIIPEVRAIRENWQPSEDATPIRIKHEVAACFVHKDAFYDFLFASKRALELLKRNFLYLQEDERILEWGYLLERTNEEMVSFRENAYNIHKLFATSGQLRNYLLKTGSAMKNVNNVEFYMEDRAGKRVVDSMFNAINCIRLVSCEGII